MKYKNVFTSIVILFSIASNATTVRIDNIYYDLNGDKANVTGRYLPSDFNDPSFHDVVIPSKVVYEGTTYTVEGIAEKAFKEDFYIFSIELPNTLTSIGDEAFYGCALREVVLPNNLNSIGYLSFGHAYQLSTIEIGNSVTSIGERAFEQCERLISVIIGNNVNTIGDNAFYNCKALERIEIQSAKNIGKSCLQYCESLTSVVLGNKVEEIGENMFFGCNSLTSIVIPGNVKKIGKSAFYSLKSLASVEIQNGVNTIEESAFRGIESLTSVILLSVKNMGNDCFSLCPNLESVILGDEVDIIGEGMFVGCTSLANITIPKSVITINKMAFHGCTDLTNVTIDNGLTTIGEYAFGGCSSLKSVIIPASVTSIGEDGYNNDANPFVNCTSLTSISVDANNPVFDSRNNCNAIVRTKDNTIIVGCTNTVIDNSITGIAGHSFYGAGLKSINIPSNVTYIGEAFSGCANLTNITVDVNNPVFDSRDNCNAIIKSWSSILEVGCKNTIIPSSVEGIWPNAFINCVGLVNMKIPEGVKTIYSNAFANCPDLISISIPSTTTKILGYAFDDCRNLEEVYSYIEEPFTIDESTFRCFDSSLVGVTGMPYRFTNATLYVPAGTMAKYKATDGWKLFKNIVEISNVHGDVNGDSEVNGGDIVTVCNVMAGISTVDPQLADVNNDGEVNVGDIVTICNIIAGKE